MLNIQNILYQSPVIAAVSDDAQLPAAIASACDVVFLLNGGVINLARNVSALKAAHKYAFVHLDLINGLSADEMAVDWVRSVCDADGVISTKAQQIRRAKKLGLASVQRAFALDSRSLKNIPAQVSQTRPDCLEILPGIAPRVLSDLHEQIQLPIIAGGLITTKGDMFAAIGAGAVGVSTSNTALWNA